jgi:hypothetical protein
MLILFLLPFSLLASSSSSSLSFSLPDFLIGFQEGIQNDPSNPSNCVKSYSSVSSTILQVLETFETLNIHTLFNLIKNLNVFFNTFVSSYDICNYSTIASRYLVDRETSILNLLINISNNIGNFLESLNYLIMALRYNDVYGTGFYLASLIRYGLGISL